MRDIFTEIFENQPIDPTEAARRSLRPKLRARFYDQTGLGEAGGAFAVLLNGKPVLTPARHALAAPSRSLAESIAAEWQVQRELIDPARMPLTRLANSIIDGVAKQPAPVAAEIEKFLGSDMLLYRAAEPEGLVASQKRHWDPVLEWARDALGARLVMAQGIVFVPQPAESIAAAAKSIPREPPYDPWRLGALNSVTVLTGSALLALALAHGRLTLDEAWAAANVDEDWNMARWGRDDAAQERLALRFAEMQAAALVLSAIA